jgi:hypothetical protein
MESTRERLTHQPGAIRQAELVHEAFDKLGPEQWNQLVSALSTGDRIAAAGVFGMTPEQMDQQFRLLKERARALIAEQPDLLKSRS